MIELEKTLDAECARRKVTLSADTRGLCLTICKAVIAGAIERAVQTSIARSDALSDVLRDLTPVLPVVHARHDHDTPALPLVCCTGCGAFFTTDGPPVCELCQALRTRAACPKRSG